jgi:hypothetical protein
VLKALQAWAIFTDSATLLPLRAGAETVRKCGLKGPETRSGAGLLPALTPFALLKLALLLWQLPLTN